MKTKLIGLGILAAVIIAAAAYVFISNSQTVTEINGYVGGEKIGLLEDEEVQDILRDRYRLVIDYAKAGSIDMVTDDAEGRDFLFPSNQTALELYKQVHGDPVKSEIILNTPIVLYTRSAVAQAAAQPGLPPFDGAGDGGFVDVQLLGNLRDGKPLEIAQLHHLPLPLGQLCLDRAVQKAAVLRALAAVGPALKAAEQVGKLVGVVEWNLLSHRVPPIISNVLCAL